MTDQWEDSKRQLPPSLANLIVSSSHAPQLSAFFRNCHSFSPSLNYTSCFSPPRIYIRGEIKLLSKSWCRCNDGATKAANDYPKHTVNTIFSISDVASTCLWSWQCTPGRWRGRSLEAGGSPCPRSETASAPPAPASWGSPEHPRISTPGQSTDRYADLGKMWQISTVLVSLQNDLMRWWHGCIDERTLLTCFIR